MHLYIVIATINTHVPLIYSNDTKCHRHTYNKSRTLAGDKTVEHSDVVGAWPVGATPITSSFST